jgi:hypothetical protein
VGSFEQAMILHRSEDVVETKALYRQILMKRQVHELPNVWPNDELSDSVIDRFWCLLRSVSPNGQVLTESGKLRRFHNRRDFHAVPALCDSDILMADRDRSAIWR